MIIEYVSIGIAVVLFFVGLKIGEKRGKKMKNDLKGELTKNMVEIANAQNRVKNGGNVAIRQNKIIAKHERSVNATVNVSEHVVAIKNESKPKENLSKKEDKDEENYVEFVARNKKTFTIDAILKDEEETNRKNNDSDEEKDK